MSFRTRTLRIASTAALIAVGVAPAVAHAQPKASAKATVGDTTTLTGAWMGRATVPLGDSTIVVPVSYNFTLSGGTISGTAMVPGQGTGQISNVVREGARVRFRVTIGADIGAGEVRQLEHDATIGNTREMEGMISYQDKPVASFKIAPAKASK